MCVYECLPERESETCTWRCSAILLWCYAMKMVLRVSKIKKVYKFALTASYATGTSRKRTASKSKRILWACVCINLFWIIRVKVEVLMVLMTIHIYCLFIFTHLLLSAHGGTAEACEWQVSISVYVIYLELSPVPSQVCIFLYFYFFFPHWESFWVSARNAVNIIETLECCVALELAVHTAKLMQVQKSSEPQPG